MADHDSRERGRDTITELGEGVRDTLKDKRSLGKTIALGAATALGFLVMYTVGAAIAAHLGQWLVLGGLGYVAYKVGKKPITKLVNSLRRLPDRLVDFFTEPADNDGQEVEGPEHRVRTPDEGREAEMAEAEMDVRGVPEVQPVAPAAQETTLPSGLVIIGEGVRNPRRAEPAAETPEAAAPATQPAAAPETPAAPAEAAAERQRQLLDLLSRMSPEERKALLAQAEAPDTPATPAAPQAATPAAPQAPARQSGGAELS